MIMVNEIDLLNKVYPIGSIYLTTNSVNPSNLIGGTWVRFGNGRTLVGVNESDTDFSTVEKTGGEKTHLLTVNEMPSHSHNLVLNSYYSNAGGNDSFAKEGYYDNTTSKTTTKTGGGQAHNNLQPYITVYMWKRTA